MNRPFVVFAQSFIGGTFDWITSGIEELATFVRDWVVARFDAQVFGVITLVVVAFAILARVNSGRRL